MYSVKPFFGVTIQDNPKENLHVGTQKGNKRMCSVRPCLGVTIQDNPKENLHVETQKGNKKCTVLGLSYG